MATVEGHGYEGCPGCFVCCKLNNFILEEKNSTIVSPSELDDIAGAKMELYAQDEGVEADRRRRDLEKSITRVHFTVIIEEMEMKRPN